MTKSDILAVGAFGFALVAAGCSVYAAFKSHRMAKKLGKSMEELEGMTDIQVSQQMVEEATQEAVQKAVKTETDAAATRIVRDIYQDMYKEVRKLVKEGCKNIQETVEKEIRDKYTAELKYMDIDDLKAEIKEEVKKATQERINKDLGNVGEDYLSQLKNATKIYREVADAIKR